MNLETKITIYKFTPQVFTLTHNRLKLHGFWNTCYILLIGCYTFYSR